MGATKSALTNHILRVCANCHYGYPTSDECHCAIQKTTHNSFTIYRFTEVDPLGTCDKWRPTDRESNTEDCADSLRRLFTSCGQCKYSIPAIGERGYNVLLCSYLRSSGCCHDHAIVDYFDTCNRWEGRELTNGKTP